MMGAGLPVKSGACTARRHKTLAIDQSNHFSQEMQVRFHKTFANWHATIVGLWLYNDIQ
jgi:hypothetical protein